MSFPSSCHCHCQSKFLLSPPTHLPQNVGSSMKKSRDPLSLSTDRSPGFPLSRQATVASPPRLDAPFGTRAVAGQYGSALTAIAPANTGDVSVFLQTSVALLFVYWIANFVVPDLMSKYLGFDKMNEGEKPEDDDTNGSSEGGEEERDGVKANSRMTKKRGFGSTRR